MRRWRTGILLAALTASAAGYREAAGQQALSLQTGVSEDTVVVGERFSSVIEVATPEGAEIEFRAPPATDAIQMASPLRQRLVEGRVRVIYPLVAWVTEAPLTVEIPIIVRTATGEETRYDVPLAMPVVRSILPPGEVEPRRSRGVFPMRPPARPIWPFGLLGLLAAGGLVWLLLRRRAPSVARVDPGEAALAAIRALLADVERRPPPESFDAGARVLRRYLALRDTDLGEGWTTTELMSRARPVLTRTGALRGLDLLLVDADRAKFSGRPTSTGDADTFLREVLAWITADAPMVETRNEAA